MSWSVTAGLTRLMMKNYAGFAVLVLLLFSGIWLLLTRRSEEFVTVAGIADVMPIRFFLLAMGAVIASSCLPVFIATGVTRREFLRGGLLHCVLISAAFGLLALGGYLLEQFVLGQAGLAGQLEQPVDGIVDALTLLSRSIGLNFGFMCAGWVMASGIYRWGGLSGFVVIPVVTVPVLLASSLADFSGPRSLALSLGLAPEQHQVELAAGNVLAIAVIIAVLAAMVALTIHRLPLRAVKS